MTWEDRLTFLQLKETIENESSIPTQQMTAAEKNISTEKQMSPVAAIADCTTSVSPKRQPQQLRGCYGRKRSLSQGNIPVSQLLLRK